MRVLFCNIAWMKYYNGITDDDVPVNGGSWVNEYKEGAECFNFTLYDDDCFHGFVATKSNRGKFNQIHIEKLEGISEEDDEADNVLVIWVATDPTKGKSYIVGWYKNATVTRYYYEDADGWPKNVYAKAKNCVLLPINKRQKIVPRAGRDGYSYGMGQSNVWFGKPQDEKYNLYLKNILKYINSYNEENLALNNY
ncbi:hypothetical protein [Caloramator sp. ALD01]|uniref:hypothetical protein n=1 Tax=Caloramator sp. ALD01 TaxID=1031288 RepID=UPI00041D8206|nr:hypothetical protein [Caloramator sp. ALD01]